MVYIYVGTPTINTVCKVGNQIISIADSSDELEIINKNSNSIMKLSTDSASGGKFRLNNNADTSNVILDTSWYCYIATNHGLIIGSSADASAALKIDSTSKGFMPPRMTTTQKNAISSPATGLVIFDTTLAKLCVYTGAAWETVTSA